MFILAHQWTLPWARWIHFNSSLHTSLTSTALIIRLFSLHVQSCSLLFRLPECETVYISPMSCSCHRHNVADLSLWTTLVVTSEEWKLWRSSMWGVLHVPLSSLVSDCVSFCSSINVWDYIVHSPSKTDIITVLIFWSFISTQQPARVIKY